MGRGLRFEKSSHKNAIKMKIGDLSRFSGNPSTPLKEIPRTSRSSHPRISNYCASLLSFQNVIFQMLELGVTESAIVKALTGLTFVAGIRDLIETSHDRGFEIVVLSDNLTLFVEAFLEFAEIRQNTF